MKKQNKLGYRLRYNLIYRLMTVVLVSLVPVCIMVLLLLVITLKSADRQVRQSWQLQVDNSMQRLETAVDAIRADMDDFVAEYISELSGSLQPESTILVYDMFRELEKIMGGSQLGFLTIREKAADRVLAQGYSESLSAGKIDEMTRILKDKLSAGETLADQSIRVIQDHCFLLCSYEYQNYSVVFWLDIGENIMNYFRSFPEELSAVYIRDGEKIWQVAEDGSVADTHLTWEACGSSGIHWQAFIWSGRLTPLEICIHTSILAWQMIPSGYWLLLVVAVLCLTLAPVLWMVLRKEIIDPFRSLSRAMEELQQEHLDYRIDDHSKRNSDEIQYLFDTFDKMAGEVQLSREKDRRMFQAELDNLRLQVNPHMLLNSFNMIYSLAQTRNYQCIQEYSLHLVDYFRYALKKNDSLAPLSQELAFVKNYIEIQKIRFPGAFSSVQDVKEDCLGAMIPPLLIENFVENAMKYALKPGEVVEVLLNIRREEDRLLISVCDTGRGMKPEILKLVQKGEVYVDRMGNRHIGIWNCKRRIELFYEEDAEINIVSTPGAGTQVFINIPFVKEESHEAVDRG